jgi:hypothetical protein
MLTLSPNTTLPMLKVNMSRLPPKKFEANGQLRLFVFCLLATALPYSYSSAAGIQPTSAFAIDFSYGCRGGVRIDSDVIRDIAIAGLLDKKADVGDNTDSPPVGKNIIPRRSPTVASTLTTMLLMATFVFTLDPANAAMTGGRMGGSSFGSSSSYSRGSSFRSSYSSGSSFRSTSSFSTGGYRSSSPTRSYSSMGGYRSSSPTRSFPSGTRSSISSPTRSYSSGSSYRSRPSTIHYHSSPSVTPSPLFANPVISPYGYGSGWFPNYWYSSQPTLPAFSHEGHHADSSVNPPAGERVYHPPSFSDVLVWSATFACVSSIVYSVQESWSDN